MDLYAPSLRIWDERYRLRRLDGTVVDESVEGTWRRIAKTLASVEKMPGWEDKFYQALEGFKFLPAGRIVAGAGAGRDGVTMMNCFVMGTIDDSMEGIFQSLKESALTMKAGGGIGMDFSTLRPNGAPVLGVESSASGPLSFMDTWNAMCKTVISAGARRGAMMGVMRCDHPDVEYFIEAKREPGRLRMFNMSVLVTDHFMHLLETDGFQDLVFDGKIYKQIRARELWNKIMRSTYEYAEPGVIFIDRINAMNNLAYCETISATNPCVVGETLIAVAGRGAVPIKQLAEEGKDVPVFACNTSTGETVVRWGRNSRLTQRNVPVLKVTLDDGSSLRTTHDHRFPLRDGRTVMAKDLVEGDSLFRFDSVVHNDGNVTIDNNRQEYHLIAEAKYGRKFDWGTGRGQYHCHHVDENHYNNSWDNIEVKLAEDHNRDHRLGDNNPMRFWWSTITEKERDDYREKMRISTSGECNGMWGRTHSDETKAKIGAKTVERFKDNGFRERHLNGVLLSMTSERGAKISRSREHMFITVTKLCEYCGNEYSFRAAPTNGKKINRKRFCSLPCVARWNAMQINQKRILDQHPINHKVVSITPDGFADVYNITVDELHNYTVITDIQELLFRKKYKITKYSGIKILNCGEQPLPPYGQCLLGSINLTAFVQDPFTANAKVHVPAICDVVKTAIRMMDNVIDITKYPLEEQRAEAFAKRRLGLGVTGWADMLIMRGIPYGSQEACRMADAIMGQIKLAAYDTSADLAKEKGAFPLFSEKYLLSPLIKGLPERLYAKIERSGIRNSHLLSIAPTGTISYFADYVSSGIEPVFEFTHERKVLMPDGSRRTETVEDYAYRLYKKIIGKEPDLSDPLWASAQNLSVKAHLHTIAAFQKHVDSAISKTINVPKDYPYEDFVKVYLDAYELGCKGCTTYRPNETTGSVLSVKSDQKVTDSSADQQPPHDLPARPIALRGTTYKYRWGDHAYYLTINDEDGTGRPYEVFLNSKDVSSFPWVVALTRMISSIFRYSASLGNDVSFVAEELQAVFDPNGGTWQNGDGRSTYVPSMPAMIGRLIGQHIAGSPSAATELAGKVTDAWFHMKPRVEGMISSFEPRKGKQCPKCGHPTLIRSEGCDHCLDCEYSSCE